MYVASRISKQYGGVRALDCVDLEIRPGEVHALLGANGAGKSTLVKILVGAERPTSGSLNLDGVAVHLNNVGDANVHGISIVSQELNLFTHLDVLDNLFLLREPRYAHVLLNRREMRRRARPAMAVVGLDERLFDRPVAHLRLGEQQRVEIARALIGKPKILFLDEPTSALQAAETQRLLDIVRGLRDDGVAVLYVSHFLEDVFEIADTITVLRNGRAVVERRPRSKMSITEAVGEMIGDARERSRRVVAPGSRSATEPNTTPLRLKGAAVTNVLSPVDLEAAPGEVVGLAGLEGSGANAVLEVIFARRRLDRGTIVFPGRQSAPHTMTAAVRAGIAFVPADRKRLGVMLEKPIYENVTIVSGGPLRRLGVILRKSVMIAHSEKWAAQLKIKMSSSRAPVAQLSGGNQQKVVFAKWLETDPKIVLLDDPTRGVDVGAKVEMHAIITQIAASKRIVLIASSDLEELAQICDRVVVFYQRAAVGELRGDELSEARLLEAINTGIV